MKSHNRVKGRSPGQGLSGAPPPLEAAPHCRAPRGVLHPQRHHGPAGRPFMPFPQPLRKQLLGRIHSDKNINYAAYKVPRSFKALLSALSWN